MQITCAHCIADDTIYLDTSATMTSVNFSIAIGLDEAQLAQLLPFCVLAVARAANVASWQVLIAEPAAQGKVRIYGIHPCLPSKSVSGESMLVPLSGRCMGKSWILSTMRHRRLQKGSRRPICWSTISPWKEGNSRLSTSWGSKGTKQMTSRKIQIIDSKARS